MKSNFEERKQNRLAAYEHLAGKAANDSDAAYNKAHEIGSYIPMGQPILVGHHSEKRHRRDIEKIDNNMRRSIEADKKQKYYQGRAEALLSNTAISSDDPNALDKLQEKLDNLKGLQELMKDANKIIRHKKHAPAEKVGQLVEMGLTEERATKLMNAGNFGGPGFPSFRITNNGANIRRIEERVKHLQRMQAIPPSDEIINGVRMVVNQEDNRIQLFFPGKPADEIRTKLKSNGFRWAPSVGAWMRHLSNNAIYYAKQILQEVK